MYYKGSSYWVMRRLLSIESAGVIALHVYTLILGQIRVAPHVEVIYFVLSL